MISDSPIAAHAADVVADSIQEWARPDNGRNRADGSLIAKEAPRGLLAQLSTKSTTTASTPDSGRAEDMSCTMVIGFLASCSSRIFSLMAVTARPSPYSGKGHR
jgi:hypothetical protein